MLAFRGRLVKYIFEEFLKIALHSAVKSVLPEVGFNR
jgi:hypothetical protein